MEEPDRLSMALRSPAGSGPYDVIVVGGGFAGAAAARDLGDAGGSVLLLEARDRLGGRTYRRPFAGTDHLLEFGGQWIAPRWQRHVAREIARYRLPLAEGPESRSFASLAGGIRRAGALPGPADEIFDLERALYELIHASHRLNSRAPLANPPADLDIPFTQWLAPLHLPRATHDYLEAWVTGAFGCSLHAVSTLSVLSWIAAYDHSVLAVHLGEGQLFADGTSSAIEAIIQDSGADVRLGSPVSRIEQDTHQVHAITMAGEVFTAAAAVIAVPLNVLKAITFSPALHAAKQAAAAEGHLGRATKVWALVRGAPPAFFGAGLGPGLIWLSTQDEWPEGSLMLGFGPGPDALDVQSIEAVGRAVEAFVPGAEVLRIDAHDWNADPYANGAWVAYGAGQLTRWGPALRTPEGRLAFAGSDLATQWAGWIDGAIADGSRAAREVESMLQSRWPATL